MIKLDRVEIRVGGFELTNISLEVRPRAYAVLMGRTGTGKTTLVEAICGVKRIDSGEIWLMNRQLSNLPPGERGIGYVPQDRALFSTMSVYENLAFALRIRRWGAGEIENGERELAELMVIGAIWQRRTHGLSGREARRVALG